jgi:hypothetical protein
MAERFFCSLRSAENREALYGTVARIRTWLLLEYPYIWRRHAVQQSGLSESAKHQFATLAERRIFIRQSHTPEPVIRCFLVDSSERNPQMVRVDAPDYNTLADCLDELPRAAVAQPLYAVCTHGTHDKCCAKFGIPVFCAFRDLAPAAAWQCSHIGGDRFAANVVVFPYGIYYGRVAYGNVGEIVQQTASGHIVLANYRGRCCYTRPIQAAEYFVRRESGRTALSEFRLAAKSASGAVFESTVDGTRHHVEIAANHGRITDLVTCTAEAPTPITQYELVRYWVESKA